MLIIKKLSEAEKQQLTEMMQKSATDNFDRMVKAAGKSDKRSKRLSVILGIFAALVFAPLGIILGVYLLAKGYKEGKWILGGGIGIVVLYVAISLFLTQQTTGEKVVFGPGEEIYYTGGVTVAEVNALGGALEEMGFFNKSGGKTVKLSKGAGSFIISFVVKEDALDNPSVILAFRQLGKQLSSDVFDESPVEIRLCDRYLSTKKVISW